MWGGRKKKSKASGGHPDSDLGTMWGNILEAESDLFDATHKTLASGDYSGPLKDMMGKVSNNRLSGFSLISVR